VAQGLLWPDSLVHLNPGFEPASTVDELVNANALDARCREIFLRDKPSTSSGEPLRLHWQQEEGFPVTIQRISHMLTTSEGSDKSLAHIISIVSHVLRRGSGQGMQAIILSPMSALVSSQINELTRFLEYGFPDGRGLVTLARYTGQEDDDERGSIMADPPRHPADKLHHARAGPKPPGGAAKTGPRGGWHAQQRNIPSQKVGRRGRFRREALNRGLEPNKGGPFSVTSRQGPDVGLREG